MTLHGRRGFTQTVRIPSYRRGGMAKSSYNFYSGWKSLIIVPLALFTVYAGGGGWLKTSYDWKRQNTVMWGGGIKLLKKLPYNIWTFPKLRRQYSYTLQLIGKYNKRCDFNLRWLFSSSAILLGFKLSPSSSHILNTKHCQISSHIVTISSCISPACCRVDVFVLITVERCYPTVIQQCVSCNINNPLIKTPKL